MKYFLQIKDCIILSNAQRIKEGALKIVDRKHLASILAEKLNCEVDTAYMRIYRAEINGSSIVDEKLIKELISELKVERSSLVLEMH
jgi:hypothetical protein